VFRVLWRFKEHRPGPPGYPEINSTTIKELLMELMNHLYKDFE
jgi:hypothetical protein